MRVVKNTSFCPIPCWMCQHHCRNVIEMPGPDYDIPHLFLCRQCLRAALDLAEVATESDVPCHCVRN